MRKIIILLFLFFLLLSCYYIYKLTEDNHKFITLIGDNIVDNPYLIDYNRGYINNDFVNKDYHINDLLNIIKYNQEKSIGNQTESIHRLLKKSDTIMISIGMNDIYYKLDSDKKEIYTYLNNIINNYEEILSIINRYNKKIYIFGYYNIDSNNNDIFTYTNYKLKNIAKKYNCKYLDLQIILHNCPKYYQKSDNFYLNNEGYRQIYKLIVEK